MTTTKPRLTEVERVAFLDASHARWGDEGRFNFTVPDPRIAKMQEAHVRWHENVIVASNLMLDDPRRNPFEAAEGRACKDLRRLTREIIGKDAGSPLEIAAQMEVLLYWMDYFGDDMDERLQAIAKQVIASVMAGCGHDRNAASALRTEVSLSSSRQSL